MVRWRSELGDIGSIEKVDNVKVVKVSKMVEGMTTPGEELRVMLSKVS